MPYHVALCALNAKYIHSSLAPWCLLAGMQAFAPEISATVCEGTINEPEDAFLARILAQNPSVATFTCYLWNIRATLRIASALKAALPHCVVVFGGPEVSYNAADVLAQNPQVDYILSGEGEESVPALVRLLVQGQTPTQGSVGGLCTRDFVSTPAILGKKVPSPYTPDYFKALGGRIAYLETSRGCPYSCAFCLSGRCGAPRYFDLEQSCQNLLALANSGAQTIKFIDRTFNASPRHANAILTFILAHYGKDIPAGVCFHFEIAGDILQEETFQLLEQMPLGAVQLEIGMQSFCEETLTAVRRKTDITVLKRNIERLVAMQNMHIHIDLIAGLPHEPLDVFGESFNTGYALGAQMLQLGFLKLLHGAAMREESDVYPCTFSQDPPYEVITTPWLTVADFDVLRGAEDALERVYNAGRFRGTAQYVLTATGMTPFAFYCALGEKIMEKGSLRLSLDDFTALLFSFCASLPNVNSDHLRDAMVCDRLTTNATGRLPACLQIKDDALIKAVKLLAQMPDTAPIPHVRRGVALLYGAKKIAFVDYTQKNVVTGQYLLHTVSVDNFFTK